MQKGKEIMYKLEGVLRTLSPVVLFFFFLFSFLGGACVFVVFKYVCILTSHVLAYIDVNTDT